jgi:hypothetical protein
MKLKNYLPKFSLVALLTFLLTNIWAQTVTLTFEDVVDLSQYQSLGVTFSPNIHLWDGGEVSIFTNPDGGPVTPPNGICVGFCGGEPGNIFFAFDVDSVSIYALSGPGSDLITSGTKIRAYDANNVLLGEALANTAVQFDLLTITAKGIRRLELISFFVNNEAWDNLTFPTQPTSETPGGLLRAEFNELSSPVIKRSDGKTLVAGFLTGGGLWKSFGIEVTDDDGRPLSGVEVKFALIPPLLV